MLRSVKRYVRERFERKGISKDKVDGYRRPRPARHYRYRTASLVPDYLKCASKNFSSQFSAFKHDTQQQQQQQQNDSSEKFKSTKCLDPTWIETFGLGGTLAFGWSLSQNVEIKRKRLLDEILSLHYSQSCPLKSVLCPYTAVKNALPRQVLTQPNEFLRSKIDVNAEGIPLPVFGPLTAEETLNEAKMGLEKVRNTAIAEFENRMGLQCMSKKRYRRAMAHFAAGAALRNSDAIFNLAQCYELGLGTSKNLTKAAKCYHASSELGNATATFNLAVFYAQGLGGLKLDKEKAGKLLLKAVELGEPHAKAALDARPKSQLEAKKETTNKRSVTNIDDHLVERVRKLKVEPFPKMEVNKVTETNHNKSMSVMTKTCADSNFGESIIIDDRVVKGIPSFSMFEVKGYSDNIQKLPVTFHDPVLPRKGHMREISQVQKKARECLRYLWRTEVP